MDFVSDDEKLMPNVREIGNVTKWDEKGIPENVAN